MCALTPLRQSSHMCKERCLVSAGKKSKLAQIMVSTCKSGSVVNLELVCSIIYICWKSW